MIGLWYNIVKRLFLQGMLAIHNSPITAHGNLRSSNCLIDSRWTCKIADFGLDSVKVNQPEEDFGDYASYRGKWTTLPFESMVTEYCLDVTYSRLLMTWKTCGATKSEIIGQFHLYISTTGTWHRGKLVFAGHCLRAKDQVISSIFKEKRENLLNICWTSQSNGQ